MKKTEIKRNDERKLRGPNEITIQNMIGYFDDLSQLLTKTNGHLLPSDNFNLQKKYKISWNTLSIAKKLKYIESLKQKEFKILKVIDRNRAIQILKTKYSHIQQKYVIISKEPYLLKGLYLKKGRRNQLETELLSKLSEILTYVFKLDKRYENSFKPGTTIKGLEKAILKYEKILELQRKRRGISDMSNQHTLFDKLNKTFLPLETEKQTSQHLGFYNGAEEKMTVSKNVNNDTDKEKKTLWIVQERINYKDLPSGPIRDVFNINYVKWFTNEKLAIKDAKFMSKINIGKNYFVSMVTDVFATEVQTIQKNVDISLLFLEIDDENKYEIIFDDEL